LRQDRVFVLLGDLSGTYVRGGFLIAKEDFVRVLHSFLQHRRFPDKFFLRVGESQLKNAARATLLHQLQLLFIETLPVSFRISERRASMLLFYREEYSFYDGCDIV